MLWKMNTKIRSSLSDQIQSFGVEFPLRFIERKIVFRPVPFFSARNSPTLTFLIFTGGILLFSEKWIGQKMFESMWARIAYDINGPRGGVDPYFDASGRRH